MEMTIHDARHVTTDSLREPLPLSSNLQRLKTHLLRETGSAISDYKMIEEGDRILCAVSGGMDSFAMLTLLLELQKRAPIRFEVIAVNVDQKQPGFPEHVLPAHFESLGVAHRVVEQDTYSVVTSKIPAGKTMCGLCSRLRRGILYRVADEIKATKIALGHHMDDIVETLFLNMFFGGKLKAMPPKLLSDDGKHVVIRPMAYCEKKDIAKFARGMNYPIIPCNLCGSQENLQRVVIRKMLAEWNTLDGRRKKNIFKAIQNVCPSHLADFSLFDFARLKGEMDQLKPL